MFAASSGVDVPRKQIKLSSAPFSMDPSIPTMENSYVPYSTIPVNANPSSMTHPPKGYYYGQEIPYPMYMTQEGVAPLRGVDPRLPFKPLQPQPYLYYGQRYYPVMQGQRSTAMLSPYFNQSSFPFVPPGPKPGPKPGPLLSPVSEVGKARGLNNRRRSRSRRRSRARRSRWVVRGE